MTYAIYKLISNGEEDRGFYSTSKTVDGVLMDAVSHVFKRGDLDNDAKDVPASEFKTRHAALVDVIKDLQVIPIYQYSEKESDLLDQALTYSKNKESLQKQIDLRNNQELNIAFARSHYALQRTLRTRLYTRPDDGLEYHRQINVDLVSAVNELTVTMFLCSFPEATEAEVRDTLRPVVEKTIKEINE